MITEELKNLLFHINRIAISRELPYTVSVEQDLINKKDTIKIVLNYMLHNKGEESKVITTRSLIVPVDQYLDEKDKIYEHMCGLVFEDILIYTNFETEENNIEETYKWN